MKTKTLLIAAAMLLCLSAASFAQAIYTTSSTPITTVIGTGNAELAGNITFTGNATPAIAGTISIQYGGNNVNITSTFGSITLCTNMNVGATAPTVSASCPAGYGTQAGLIVDLNASTYSPGLLVIDIPAGLVGPGQFTVGGVRVQINGTGLTSLVANISATGNLIQAGSTVLTVINNTQGVGIASVASYTDTPPIPSKPTAGAPSLNAVTGGLTGANTTIVVQEGFLAAFTKGVGVRITVSAIPPKGLTFQFLPTATSYDANGAAINANWVRGDSTGGTATGNYTISSSSTNTGDLQVYYYVATDTNADPVNIEYLEIPVTIAASSSNVPYSAATFTYTVSLAPIANAYKSGSPSGLPVPRFAVLESSAANLVTIVGSSTALLIPYGYASKTAGDFNTAMAIANTTEDPGAANLGLAKGAVPNAGPVTFYLFPMDTTLPMFTYKTVAGSPGSGLDASGNVVSGGTYSVFLSQIFPLATPPTGSTAVLGNVFQGYIIITTGFTNGHGIFVISNFTTLTAQSSLMMVLTNRQGFPEAVGF